MRLLLRSAFYSVFCMLFSVVYTMNPNTISFRDFALHLHAHGFWNLVLGVGLLIWGVQFAWEIGGSFESKVPNRPAEQVSDRGSAVDTPQERSPFFKQFCGAKDDSGKLEAIMNLATTRGDTGGLWKRIDENRELLEELRRKSPTVLLEHWWITGWIQSNDAFFVQLQEILRLPPVRTMGPDGKYPRPWPADLEHAPVDELAALRKAVTMMGFDAKELAVSAMHVPVEETLATVLSAVTIDQRQLEHKDGDASTTGKRGLLARIRPVSNTR